GEIGVIASVTRPFCGGCTRARLSAEGSLYTCLFAEHGTDLRGPLRSGATDADLERLLGGLWRRRDDRYSEIRSAAPTSRPKVEMSHIGGGPPGHAVGYDPGMATLAAQARSRTANRGGRVLPKGWPDFLLQLLLFAA